MSRGQAAGTIPKLVSAGIENAARAYRRWTNDDAWLNQAPEYLMTVEIARALHRGFGDTTRVWLERSVQETISYSGSRKPGVERKALNRNGRTDILLYRKNETPWCAIEVKRRVSNRAVVADVSRLAALLAHRRAGASLQCAVLALYHDCAEGVNSTKAKRKEALLLTVNRSIEAARTLCKSQKHPDVRISLRDLHIHDEGMHGAWAAYCVMLEAPRRRG